MAGIRFGYSNEAIVASEDVIPNCPMCHSSLLALKLPPAKASCGLLALKLPRRQAGRPACTKRSGEGKSAKASGQACLHEAFRRRQVSEGKRRLQPEGWNPGVGRGNVWTPIAIGMTVALCAISYIVVSQCKRDMRDCYKITRFLSLDGIHPERFTVKGSS